MSDDLKRQIKGSIIVVVVSLIAWILFPIVYQGIKASPQNAEATEQR